MSKQDGKFHVGGIAQLGLRWVQRVVPSNALGESEVRMFLQVFIENEWHDVPTCIEFREIGAMK